MQHTFEPGIETLLGRNRRWLRGKRVGLVSHLAAVDRHGCTTAERLYRDPDVDLRCLLGPEHGFFGLGGAGIPCHHATHPTWSIPVYSLYGETRKPTPDMLESIDVLVYDMQDIGARCFTYVSTLKLVLDAAAENAVEVIVADRPIPLPRVTDGPLPCDTFKSFVAQVDTPLAYGMTPGETAVWMRDRDKLSLPLRVAGMQGYLRDAGRGASWPHWLPPSPAMRSWESAMCFPATVIAEAFPHLDHGRATNLPFQVVGAPWIEGEQLAGALDSAKLPGVRFYAHRYDSRPRDPEPVVLDGVRMAVIDPHRFRPAATAVTLLATMQDLYGINRVWKRGVCRPDFFDKLMGTDSVRKELRCGRPRREIAAGWTAGLRRFRAQRAKNLLYKPEPR